jgi:hypothetical protein
MMTKKTVHIVIEGGCVVDAFADCDVDVVVYDLDCQDPEMRAEVEASVEALKTNLNEIEIL